MDKRGFVARAQSNCRVSDKYFVIKLPDAWKVILFDLHYGFFKFGKTLLKGCIGVTQGSPLSPAIAELVIQVTEKRNSSRFIAESKMWIMMVVRWVDDIYIALVCKNVPSAWIDTKLKLRKTIDQFATKMHEDVKSAYTMTGLQLKVEDPTFFAGFSLRWNSGRIITSAIVPMNPLTARKLISADSVIPRSMKGAICYGMLVSFIDRTVIFDSGVIRTLRRLCMSMDAAHLKCLRIMAIKKLVARNQKLTQVFDGVISWTTFGRLQINFEMDVE